MIAQCFRKLLDKVEELQAKLVISLIGREIDLHFRDVQRSVLRSLGNQTQ